MSSVVMFSGRTGEQEQYRHEIRLRNARQMGEQREIQNIFREIDPNNPLLLNISRKFMRFRELTFIILLLLCAIYLVISFHLHPAIALIPSLLYNIYILIKIALLFRGGVEKKELYLDISEYIGMLIYEALLCLCVNESTRVPLILLSLPLITVIIIRIAFSNGWKQEIQSAHTLCLSIWRGFLLSITLSVSLKLDEMIDKGWPAVLSPYWVLFAGLIIASMGVVLICAGTGFSFIYGQSQIYDLYIALWLFYSVVGLTISSLTFALYFLTAMESEDKNFSNGLYTPMMYILGVVIFTAVLAHKIPTWIFNFIYKNDHPNAQQFLEENPIQRNDDEEEENETMQGKLPTLNNRTKPNFLVRFSQSYFKTVGKLKDLFFKKGEDHTNTRIVSPMGKSRPTSNNFLYPMTLEFEKLGCSSMNTSLERGMERSQNKLMFFDNKLLNMHIEESTNVKSLPDIDKEHLFTETKPKSYKNIFSEIFSKSMNNQSNNQEIEESSNGQNPFKYPRNKGSWDVQSERDYKYVHKCMERAIVEEENHPNSNSAHAGNLCAICYDGQTDAVFLYCGHGGICTLCASRLMLTTSECYLCRTRIAQVAQIELTHTNVTDFYRVLKWIDRPLAETIIKNHLLGEISVSENEIVVAGELEEEGGIEMGNNGMGSAADNMQRISLAHSTNPTNNIWGTVVGILNTSSQDIFSPDTSILPSPSFGPHAEEQHILFHGGTNSRINIDRSEVSGLEDNRLSNPIVIEERSEALEEESQMATLPADLNNIVIFRGRRNSISGTSLSINTSNLGEKLDTEVQSLTP